MEVHTQAKHRVLTAYLDAWLPVLGLQGKKEARSRGRGPRVLIVDGFAGWGRYSKGEPGSPLLMLNALLSHKSLAGLESVQFTFLFIEIDVRRCEYLREQISEMTIPKNLVVLVENGAFEEVFVKLVESIKGSDRTPIPTFAFIDPFGYSQASMSLTGRFLDFPRSEALFFLPLSFIHRFVGREGQEEALNNLFDSDRWREAIPLKGAERSTFLLSLFEGQLQRQGHVKYVRSFSMRTKDGNDYCLVFATGHIRGLNLMKSAMWAVDPIHGTNYTARTESILQPLFVPEPDTRPLLEELGTAVDLVDSFGV